MYLFAFGPLNLRREDLWEITNGEFCDMISAYHYKKFRERQEQAQHTTALLNMWSKNKISVQDFTGIYKDGRILSKEEFITEWKDERRQRKEAKINGEFRRKTQNHNRSKRKRG